MATVKNVQATSHVICFVGESGAVEKLTLFPGVNLNVNNTKWQYAKTHPVVKGLIEEGILSVLRSAPTSEGELLGFEVITDKKSDEPLPLISHTTAKTTRARKGV